MIKIFDCPQNILKWIYKYQGLIEQLEIENVYCHTNTGQLCNNVTPESNTLYIGCPQIIEKLPETEKTITIKRDDTLINSLNGYTPYNKKLDIAFVNNSNKAVIGYNKTSNIYYIGQLEKPALLPKILRLLAIARDIAKRGELDEYNDPLAEFMAETPVIVSTLIKLDTRKCKDGVNIVIDGNKITLIIQVKGQSKYVTVKGKIYELTRGYLNIEGYVKLRYNIGESEASFKKAKGSLYVDYYEGGEVAESGPHPNVNTENDNVCLGSYQPPPLKLDTELCSQASRIADEIRRLMLRPELYDSYDRWLLYLLDPIEFEGRYARRLSTAW